MRAEIPHPPQVVQGLFEKRFSPIETIQAISTLFATTATLHSAVAHAAEIAIKTEEPQIVEQTTRLLELMARDRHTLPSPRQVDS